MCRYLKYEETIILLLWCTMEDENLKSPEYTYVVYAQPAETEWEIGNKAMGTKAVYPL